MSLALGLRPDRDRDLAGEVDADVRALPHRGAPALADRSDPRRGRCAADLDVRREADPAVAALLPRFLLLATEVLVADDFERPVERLLVVAGVVLKPPENPGVVRE